MEANFKWMDGRKIRSRTSISAPYVSIGSGRIYLNASAAEKIGADTQKVKVGLDRKNKLVAIKPADKNDPTAIPIKKAGGSGKDYGGRQINAKKLVETILGDEPQGTNQYEAKWDDNGQFLVVNLNKKL